MVLQRENGLLIFAAYRYIFNYNDALEAEIHALMQGMALALQHSDMPVIVQSDSSNALAIIEGDAWARSAYGHLAEEIKTLMVDREFIPLKISRDHNRVAHLLVHYSRTNACTAVWLNSSPSFCDDLLSRDCNPTCLE
uniref:RNase H type-1 domain-containing protein n=1 Tax=Hordeum vulgare subsp. vulgare TaxID=112509 RepID=A0A8I6XS42_HORVV